MRAPDSDRQRDAALQRVRVGLTGLAAVFVLTLLAASILALLGQDRGARGGQQLGSVAGHDAPKEPLAELGVAPGNAPRQPDSAVRPAAVPAPAAPPSR